MSEPARPERWTTAVAGGLAALVALATSVFLDGLSDSIPSLIHGVAQAIVRVTPGDLAREGIEVVGRNDKPLLVAGTVVVSVLFGFLLGGRSSDDRRLLPAGLVGFGLVGGATTAWATTGSTGGALIAAAGSVAAGLAAWFTVVAAVRPLATTPTAPPTIGQAATRRRFLTTAGFTAVGAGAATLVGRRLQANRIAEAERQAVVLPAPSATAPTVPAGTETGIEGVSPVVTPNADFYRIDEALVVPAVDLDSWALEITGMVDHPLRLSYDDLLAEDLVEHHVTIACVSNEIGGNLIGNALWLGVPLARLLERAGVQDGADQLVGRSVDGFTVGFPTEVALDGRGALVAVGMNGETLPRDHGFPARLIVPGLYGYVSATKWLKTIELTTWDAFDAYWIERGWAKEGPIKTQSRIDVPRGSVATGARAVAGVAWAQHRGIEKVEVRFDDGEWQEAILADAINEDTWRQWHLPWDATPGRHQIEVRATDANGDVQPEERAPVFPDGATGYHRVIVEVSS